MKYLYLLLLCSISVSTFGQIEEEKLHGNWLFSEAIPSQNTADLIKEMDLVLQINSDKTFKMVQKGSLHVSGTWKLEVNNLLLTGKKEIESEKEIKTESMTIDSVSDTTLLFVVKGENNKNKTKNDFKMKLVKVEND